MRDNAGAEQTHADLIARWDYNGPIHLANRNPFSETRRDCRPGTALVSQATRTAGAGTTSKLWTWFEYAVLAKRESGIIALRGLVCPA